MRNPIQHSSPYGPFIERNATGLIIQRVIQTVKGDSDLQYLENDSTVPYSKKKAKTIDTY